MIVRAGDSNAPQHPGGPHRRGARLGSAGRGLAPRLLGGLLLLAPLALAPGCDDAAGSPADRARPPAEQNEGVADDGTPIVFAGARTARKRAVPTARQRDQDNLIREPNEPDPEGGDFTLEEAVVGMPIDGTLVLELQTELGTILCDLYADRAPRTVANFVGLARGLRPWWDARAGQWVRRPYYEGLEIHRVIPEYMIQGGDYLGDGSGTVGYTIPDELHDTLAHDRAGQLAMANHDGPDTAGAQFFISDGPAPQLDAGGYTIFGQCRPQHVISQIARVPQNPDEGNRPLTAVHLARVYIRRVEGGAEAATPTMPVLPEGEPEAPRGASPGPTAGRGRYDPRRYGEPSPMPAGRSGPPRGPLGGGHAGHNH